MIAVVLYSEDTCFSWLTKFFVTFISLHITSPALNFTITVFLYFFVLFTDHSATTTKFNLNLLRVSRNEMSWSTDRDDSLKSSWIYAILTISERRILSFDMVPYSCFIMSKFTHLDYDTSLKVLAGSCGIASEIASLCNKSALSVTWLHLKYMMYVHDCARI
jgi:hypothetical protein